MDSLVRKKYYLLVLLCTVFMLVACGSNAETTQGGKSTPTSGADTQVPVLPTSTVKPTPTGQSIASTATEVTKPMETPSSANAVIVTTDKTQYAINDSIAVTVANHLSTGIYASAYYTNCTPVQLQMKSGTIWNVLGRCPEATQSALVIQPGSPKVFMLRPTKNPAVPRVGSGVWVPGTYRISYKYTLQPDADSAQGGINIVSEEFTINS